MNNRDELILLECDGVICKYLSTKDNSIVVEEGAIAIPGVNRITEYRGIITWSLEESLLKQINDMNRICNKYFNISNKEILKRAREGGGWAFGKFSDFEAIEILTLSKKFNLNIKMVDVDSGEELKV